jgi:hypothetical protein
MLTGKQGGEVSACILSLNREMVFKKNKMRGVLEREEEDPRGKEMNEARQWPRSAPGMLTMGLPAALRPLLPHRTHAHKV